MVFDNSWGKSSVRVSKIIRGKTADEFMEIRADIQLKGDVESAYTKGDNSQVIPTDTMKNTVYAIAQDHLDNDLEAFGECVATHFLAKDGVTESSVELTAKRWDRVDSQGFTGGSSEQRIARVASDGNTTTFGGGLTGLVVLKTGGSGFSGFPRDQYTTLPETDDRILATSVEAHWVYDPRPDDTTTVWKGVRSAIIDGFFGEWSASIQQQGWIMATGVLETVPEITKITFRLPNQHHLPIDFIPMGVEDKGVVFHPVDEPYGDIRFTATR